MPSPQLRKRQKRTSPKRILGAAVALVVAFLLLTSVVSLAEKYLTIRHRVRDLKAQEAEAISKQDELKKENQYITTKEGQERELREKYNVVKPGEGMIIITDPAPASSDEPTSRVGKWWDSLLRGLGIRKD